MIITNLPKTTHMFAVKARREIRTDDSLTVLLPRKASNLSGLNMFKVDMTPK